MFVTSLQYEVDYLIKLLLSRLRVIDCSVDRLKTTAGEHKFEMETQISTCSFAQYFLSCSSSTEGKGLWRG